MYQILEECPGILGILDDVCVFKKTEEEHDENLRTLMEVIKKRGLVFSKEKCHMKKDKINFYGLFWDSKGTHPDPKKCANISRKSSPKNVTELPQFCSVYEPIHPMLEWIGIWQWTSSHEQAFTKLKEIIHEDLTLRYFDPSIPSVNEVDSSSNGLGAALSQNGKPVVFASKSLADTEKRYANIERELLRVVFRCERFHTYIYGKPVSVKSDHNCFNRCNIKILRVHPHDCKECCFEFSPTTVQ